MPAPTARSISASVPEAWRNYPSFRMPVFPRFMPARHRPGLPALEERCSARLADLVGDAYDSREALDAFLEYRTSLWSLLTYASAREDRVELICAWIDFLFSIDDVFAGASEARIRELGLQDLCAVIDGRPAATDTAYTRAFCLLRQRSLTLMPDGIWARYAHTLHGFLHTCRLEREIVQDIGALDLPTYETHRNSSIGECCFPLLEFALGIDLGQALRRLPELRRLNVLVARHWIGVNDLFSYRKELHSGDAMNEMQIALADNGGDLQGAVDRVAATVRRTEAEFDRLAAHLRAGTAGGSSPLPAYLRALEELIAGNLEWSYLTPRYNGRGHVWNGLTDAHVVLTPHRTLYLPHPLA
ncbi:terpene synthase family protein [Streptomyces hawaiiensis]|uniref:terpene synthase family protein n=1 Tax=Streptomyces hawaiiensis TaxID=67305 RepID=UPI003653FF4E